MKASIAILAILAATGGQAAIGQGEPMHVVRPATTRWMPVPPSLPKGAEIAIMAGNPEKPGPFAFRVRVPAHYAIGLHTHPSAENLTVIAGTIQHGMSADRAKAITISAGDFLYLPPHTAHALWAGDRPAIVQVNGTGPFSITYINPADDPRKRQGR